MTEVYKDNCIAKTVPSSVDAFAPTESKPLSAGTLKIIAYVSMVIDHIGYVFLSPLVAAHPTDETIRLLYLLSRSLGRATIVILGFLLVEGFFHTGNRLRYANRLGAIALISEPVYDLMKTGSLFSLSSQNAVMTLFFSFLMLWAMDHAVKKSVYYSVPIIGVTLLLGYILKLDYGMTVPVYIAGLYLFRQKPLAGYLVGALVFWIGYKGNPVFGVPAVMTLFLIALFYNGKKGMDIKYCGYVFYPLHMLVLWAVKMLLV